MGGPHSVLNDWVTESLKRTENDLLLRKRKFSSPQPTAHSLGLFLPEGLWPEAWGPLKRPTSPAHPADFEFTSFYIYGNDFLIINEWMNQPIKKSLFLLLGQFFWRTLTTPPAYLTGTREVNHQSEPSGWWGMSPQGKHIPWEAGIWFLRGVMRRRRKTFPNFICPVILFRAPVLEDTDYKNNRWETPLTWKEWNVPSISHTNPQTPTGLYTPYALVLIL